DFFLCGPATSANPDCSTGGTGAGSGKTLVDTSSPANTTDGISGANSDDVNTSTSKLAPGYYCFRAVATLTNYDSPPAFTDSTNEQHDCLHREQDDLLASHVRVQRPERRWLDESLRDVQRHDRQHRHAVTAGRRRTVQQERPRSTRGLSLYGRSVRTPG